MTTLIRDLRNCPDQKVTLKGWLAAKREGGGIIFLQLRDGSGLCQCIIEAAAADSFEQARALTLESSFSVTGTVRADERAPGGYELAVSSLQTIHISNDYPISRKAHGIDFLMSNRHLWLRSARQAAILKIRHTIIKSSRDFFDEQDFTLIDTPILTPGAGEDTQTLFPVKYFDQNAFLSQTGQLYLESACMALGKVYCFGPTFRAEKSKTRRHLTEFWMIEPEVAFAELTDVMDLAENMVRRIVTDVLKNHEDDLKLIGRDTEQLQKISEPFARISYSDAVNILKDPRTHEKLLNDQKADERNLEELKKSIKNKESLLSSSSKEWKREKLQSELSSMKEKEKELQRSIANRPGHIESAASFEWGKDLGGSDETIIAKHFDRPVFVTHYPVKAKAFYMKLAGDGKTVLNMDLLAPEGYGEIIGGSQREDSLDLLRDRMVAKDLVPEEYDWYLDLRRYGSVPHGGFGLGIERTVTWICGLPHVRETIPFPRTLDRLYP